MKFSEEQKLIVLMLCDVMKVLESKGNEISFDPSFIESAVCSGHSWGIPMKYHLFKGEPLPKNVNEVFCILEMWRQIESAIFQLSSVEQEEIKKEYPKTKFPGFDGNEESEQFNIAHFIIDNLKRFDEFKGRDLNTHYPIIGCYQRMLVVFEALGALPQKEGKCQKNRHNIKNMLCLREIHSKPRKGTFPCIQYYQVYPN